MGRVGEDGRVQVAHEHRRRCATRAGDGRAGSGTPGWRGAKRLPRNAFVGSRAGRRGWCGTRRAAPRRESRPPRTTGGRRARRRVPPAAQAQGQRVRLARTRACRRGRRRRACRATTSLPRAGSSSRSPPAGGCPRRARWSRGIGARCASDQAAFHAAQVERRQLGPVFDRLPLAPPGQRQRLRPANAPDERNGGSQRDSARSRVTASPAAERDPLVARVHATRRTWAGSGRIGRGLHARLVGCRCASCTSSAVGVAQERIGAAGHHADALVALGGRRSRATRIAAAGATAGGRRRVGRRHRRAAGGGGGYGSTNGSAGARSVRRGPSGARRSRARNTRRRPPACRRG